MNTFANATETLKHMELMYSVYGETLLSIWVTADGKHLSETVLYNLAIEGKIRWTCSDTLSPYALPKYYFIADDEDREFRERDGMFDPTPMFHDAPAVLVCAAALDSYEAPTSLDVYEVAADMLMPELDTFEFIECGDKVRVNPQFGRRMFEGYVEVSDAVNQRALVRHWRGNYRMEVGVDELELLLKASALTSAEAEISA